MKGCGHVRDHHQRSCVRRSIEGEPSRLPTLLKRALKPCNDVGGHLSDLAMHTGAKRCIVGPGRTHQTQPMRLCMFGKRLDEPPQSQTLIGELICLLRKGMERLPLLLDDGTSKIVLCGEMVVNGGRAHLQSIGQVVVAEGIEAPCSKELLSEVQDVFTRGHRAIY